MYIYYLTLNKLKQRASNRPQQPEIIDYLVKNYDPKKLLPLKVRKENNHYVIVDGQHRFEAAKILKLKFLPCTTHYRKQRVMHHKIAFPVDIMRERNKLL